MREEYLRLLSFLQAGKFEEARASMAHSDELRDEFNQKVEDIRKDMLAQVRSDARAIHDLTARLHTPD